MAKRFGVSKNRILHESDGVILDYEISGDAKVFETSGDYFYNVLTIQEDSKIEVGPTIQPFFLGGKVEDYEVSADGHTATKVNPDGFDFGKDTAWGEFARSFQEAQEEAGIEDVGVLGDNDEGVTDFTPIIGARVRFMQENLSDKELAKLKKAGKATVRTDANGKEWPLTKTIVSKFYGKEEAKQRTAKLPAKAQGGAKAATAAPKSLGEVKAMLAKRKTA